MSNTLNWFELFVTDLPRAKRFYEQLLGITLRGVDFQGEPNALFMQGDDAQGALALRKGRAPSKDGALVYLNCNGILDAALARVAKAGGTVVMPKTDIGPPGFIAVVLDTEGNAVGLHAERQ